MTKCGGRVRTHVVSELWQSQCHLGGGISLTMGILVTSFFTGQSRKSGRHLSSPGSSSHYLAGVDGKICNIDSHLSLSGRENVL